ncbi:MAG: AI-2E family transporter [Hyphomicrobiaceae bacterium]|nr:AI-2E family transporter [Hyphomicrobiaceae bacterium]
MIVDGWLRTSAIVIATAAIFAVVYLASSVLAPVAAALFIVAIVWPLQRRLQARLPRLLALAIVILATMVVFLAFSSLIAWSFGRVARWLFAEAPRFQLLYEQVTMWLESHGVGIASLWTEHFNVRWLIGAVQETTRRLNTTVSFWLVVLVYVILGLLEVDDIGRKIHNMRNREAARILLDGTAISAARFRSYLLIRSLMSLATGALVWALAAIAGLELAAEWGVIAFALNYIPFIGPFIATLLPTLFALAQFASLQAALVVFACLNVIQFVIGSYIEPRLSGSMLAISPFAVLFAVFLWTFLWGLFGAFIGVPITIALLTFCAQHASSRWLSDLLGAPGNEPTDETR